MCFNKIVKGIIKLPYRLFRKICRIVYKICYHLYPLPVKPTVVIVMDGGLCSQMFDYELGELFRESGYLVKFDLTWFKNCGRDVFGKDARFFELNKIYPELKIKNASKICIEKFRDKCKNSEYDIEKCIENKKNTYLINDKPLTLPNKRLNEILKKLFSNPSPKLDDVNLSLKEEIIQTKNSCAVHVRRGDLADAGIAKNSGYGKLVSDNYYKKAVSFMNRLIPDVKFYFFSDDMDYVQKNLIPLFGKINYRIVSENKNTILNGGGYKDFYLISLCKNQICSLGSFGIIAAQINKNPEKIVITTSRSIIDIKNLLVLDSDGNLIKSTVKASL